MTIRLTSASARAWSLISRSLRYSGSISLPSLAASYALRARSLAISVSTVVRSIFEMGRFDWKEECKLDSLSAPVAAAYRRWRHRLRYEVLWQGGASAATSRTSAARPVCSSLGETRARRRLPSASNAWYRTTCRTPAAPVTSRSPEEWLSLRSYEMRQQRELGLSVPRRFPSPLRKSQSPPSARCPAGCPAAVFSATTISGWTLRLLLRLLETQPRLFEMVARDSRRARLLRPARCQLGVRCDQDGLLLARKPRAQGHPRQLQRSGGGDVSRPAGGTCCPSTHLTVHFGDARPPHNTRVVAEMDEATRSAGILPGLTRGVVHW